MKTIQIRSYGDNSVLEYVEIEEPPVNEKEVLIEVYAAGVNPIDWKIRSGNYANFIKLPFPIKLGVDASGVVKKVGSMVRDFKLDDRVYTSIRPYGRGAFAEYVSVDESIIARAPDSCSFIEAAGVPLAGLSALQALKVYGGLTKVNKVLIHGGAGGIGTFAIQIAKHFGAYVATTVRKEKVSFVKDLGADLAIDYNNERVEDKIKGYDMVLDTVGGETCKNSYSLLRPGGVMVSLISKPDEALSQKYSVEAKYLQTKQNREDLKELADLVDHGRIKIIIDREFPLKNTADALEYLEKGHRKGKVVIKVK